MEVITLVTGRIEAGRFRDLEESYREVVAAGLPPILAETFLLRTGDDQAGILSVWHRRADLEAMLASDEEPVARRLIRAAGGDPQVQIFDISVHGARD
ncbi:MAG TPA: hypothetical protein VK838_04365 [Candidatus Limnocylindrales bacterium]|nr:hypothetical protein [Candidatus Limnocylindrales bacterium]